MPRIAFTQNIQRHVACPRTDAPGSTVHEVLSAFFSDNERARSYVLDDQGALRPHMSVFINGRPIRDREALSDTVPDDGEVFVMQALSGG